MAGGFLDGPRRRARGLGVGLLTALLAAPWALSPTVSKALADGADQAADAASTDAATSGEAKQAPPSRHRNEKSIIIDADAVASDPDVAAEPDVAEIADESDDSAEEFSEANGESSDQLTDGTTDEFTDEEADFPEPVASVSDYDYDAGPSGLAEGDDLHDAKDGDDELLADEPPAKGDAPEPTLATQAASFNGIVPGETTREEVIDQWGKPASQTSRGDVLTYEFKSFPSVVVNFDGDTVASLRVELFEPASADRLIAKLGLDGVEPVELRSQTGAGVSTIFPERGVSLNHRPAIAAALATDDDSAGALPEGEDAVYEIELCRIEAAPFLLRAESATAGQRTRQLADLESALRFDPASAPARAMLSGLKLATGQAVNAEKLAAEAVQLEPRNDQYRLLWAKCLKNLAQYDAAVREARTVLEGPHATPLVRAQALEQMALLAGLGSKEVQQRAVPLHNKAIAMADQLTKSTDPAIRIPATQLLINAHLAVAERISMGQWKNKDQAVGDWIGRASGLAENMIAGGEADASLRLQVAVSALVAGGRLDPPIDPALWIAEAEQTVNRLYEEIDDPAARAELDWQLGLAYYYATEIQHQRGKAENALKYGALADAALSPLAEARAEFPDTDYILGRLYFQIGAVHAVHGQDHAVACQWYDRAFDSLMRPVPVTELAGPKAHGDALVSMGVSYWEMGQRDRAYDLTKAGVELVEQGVNEKLLAADALDVPMHNLEAMNRALGKIETTVATAPTTVETKVAQARPQPSQKRMGVKRPTRSQTRMANRRNSESNGTRRR